MAEFDIADFFSSEMSELMAVTRVAQGSLGPPFADLVARTAGSLADGGKLLIFGNGGSAADAQHLATEFTVRYVTDRQAIPALALTADSAALTAIGNDLGFDRLFARQVDALGRAGDIALGLSTSGRSRNVVLGLQAARDKGLVAAAFSGGDGGDLVGLADPLLIVPSRTTARIQELHLTLGQMLCGAVERSLGLV